MRVHAHDRGYSPHAAQGAAALSAAVTTTKSIGDVSALAWAHKSAGTRKPIPSHSSGGGPGEALLLEKRPPPAFSPSHPNIPPSSALRAARMYLETSRG